MNNIFGFAFHSPLIITTLVPPKEYAPVLLISDSVSDIKRDLSQGVAKSQGKPLVILAGSLTILHGFLKEFMEDKIENPVKVLLFDFPGLLVPFNLPCVEWLDCDNQSGGAWQITKLFCPTNFWQKLNDLSFLDKETAEALTQVTRYKPKERSLEIEEILNYLPEHYKDLLKQEEEKVKVKAAKKATKKKESAQEL